MCPEQAFSSDKTVPVLLHGVSTHGLYRRIAKENHRLCLTVATVLEEIQCKLNCKNLQWFLNNI